MMETNEVVSGGNGTRLDGSNRFVLNEKLQIVAEQLKQALEKFDYELVDYERMTQPLSFQTKTPTIYREPKE